MGEKLATPEMLTYLLNGHKVRRQIWPDNYWLELEETHPADYNQDPKRPIVVDNHVNLVYQSQKIWHLIPYQLQQSDITAKDWEIL